MTILKPLRSLAGLVMLGLLVGCSSNEGCVQQVANRPGMTCLDVGFGWYHFEYASQAPRYEPPQPQAYSDHTFMTAPTAAAARE